MSHLIPFRLGEVKKVQIVPWIVRWRFHDNGVTIRDRTTVPSGVFLISIYHADDILDTDKELSIHYTAQTRVPSSHSPSIHLAQLPQVLPYLDLRTLIGASLHGFDYNQYSSPQMTYSSLQNPIVLARRIEIERSRCQRQYNLCLKSTLTHQKAAPRDMPKSIRYNPLVFWKKAYIPVAVLPPRETFPGETPRQSLPTRAYRGA
jgi:hypothetical protein